MLLISIMAQTLTFVAAFEPSNQEVATVPYRGRILSCVEFDKTRKGWDACKANSCGNFFQAETTILGEKAERVGKPVRPYETGLEEISRG
jgi:hypothetical protein